jgi:hypothetical protein
VGHRKIGQRPFDGNQAVQDEPDPATYLHSTIGCWLRDRLSPLLGEVGELIENPRGPRPDPSLCSG